VQAGSGYLSQSAALFVPQRAASATVRAPDGVVTAIAGSGR
jgi:hypothetical protein